MVADFPCVRAVAPTYRNVAAATVASGTYKGLAVRDCRRVPQDLAGARGERCREFLGAYSATLDTINDGATAGGLVDLSMTMKDGVRTRKNLDVNAARGAGLAVGVAAAQAALGRKNLHRCAPKPRGGVGWLTRGARFGVHYGPSAFAILGAYQMTRSATDRGLHPE